ncbi:MAG: serine/threonine protein kinase [Deltaproteobacteria bacterium]|nr:serine/threonine protein kinase [Deltaproteobacteria bacterium]
MSPAKRIGERIGKYRVLRPLGSGGMAELFVAESEEGHAHQVALKVIHPHLEKQQRFVDMFLDEGRIVGRIDHANVVSIEDLGTADGRHYIAMEYVDGMSLGALLESAERHQEEIPVAVAVRIIGDVLEGLHAAHELVGADGRSLDVVHRDVSPQNVLVGHDGRVVVIDFGIAKARGRIHRTEHGNVKGKLRYMAPEHCGGQGVDRRADLYAAAIILWEMLTLTPYFREASATGLIQQVRQPRFRPMAPWNKRVTAPLEMVLRRALRANPADRYESAQAFGRALVEACPASGAVGPAHLAAFVASLPDRDHVPQDELTAISGRSSRGGAAAYTFHVIVPGGPHQDDGTPATRILGGRRGSPPPPDPRRPRPRGVSRRRSPATTALFAAAVMFVCFFAGASGVAMGHAYDRLSHGDDASGWLAEAPAPASRSLLSAGKKHMITTHGVRPASCSAKGHHHATPTTHTPPHRAPVDPERLRGPNRPGLRG